MPTMKTITDGTTVYDIEDPNALKTDGGSMTGDIDMGANSITNLATPTNDTDAATKKYVDDAIAAAIASLATT